MQVELKRELQLVKEIVMILNTVVKGIKKVTSLLGRMKTKNPFLGMLIHDYWRKFNSESLRYLIIKEDFNIILRCRSEHELEEFYREKTYKDSMKELNRECRDFLLKEYSEIHDSIKEYGGIVKKIMHPEKSQKEFISLLESRIEAIKIQSESLKEILQFAADNEIGKVIEKYEGQHGNK